MSYVRVSKRENPFVQIDKAFLGNGKLSLKATGLLTYILSKPDNWKIRLKDIQKRFTDGETSVSTAMQELMKAGYIYRYQERKENGKFGDWIYEVYERPEYNPHYSHSPKRENPVSSPKRDFPDSVNPDTGNPVYNNNEFNNNDLSNNKNKEEEEEAKLSQLLKLIDEHVTKVNDVIRDSLTSWIKKLDYEVIREEIIYCIKKGKGYIYLENMLAQDEEQGVNSLDSLLEKRKSYSNSRTAQEPKIKNKGNSKRYSKPLRTEAKPEWLEDWYSHLGGQKQTENENTNDLDDQAKELMERLKKYE